MNIVAYFPIDVVNGPGTRCTLFVSGCDHKCPGCYNTKTWSVNAGEPFTIQHQHRIIDDLSDTRIPRQGLSLSGGDPLLPVNLHSIKTLLSAVKQQCPTKDIWCWTGYRYDELSEEQLQVLDYVDVLVDGRFEKEHASPGLPWRGSSNQRIIYCNNM